MLIVWVFVYKKLAQFAVRCALPPRRSESPVCATDNKPSCVLHLLRWFIGSRGFSSLERRPEFWVLHMFSGDLLLEPSPILCVTCFESCRNGSLGGRAECSEYAELHKEAIINPLGKGLAL